MPYRQYGSEPDKHFWSEKWNRTQLNRAIASLERGNQILKKAFLCYLPHETPILDGGCGAGRWVIYLHSQGYMITGLDWDYRIIDRLKEFSPEIAWKVGDVSELPFDDSTFGAYISLGVFEHLFGNFRIALREAHRVLQSNGTLFLSVPYYSILRKMKRAYLEENLAPFYQYIFDKEELLHEIEICGFRIIAATPFDAFRGLVIEIGALKRIAKSVLSNRTRQNRSSLLQQIKDALSRLMESRWSRYLFSHMILVIAKKRD